LNLASNTQGSKEIEIIFGDKNYFSFPKPVLLIKYLCQMILDSNDTCLDFFAGSSTTAHAVMQLNAEDSKNRKFILVQLPELTDPKSEAFKNGYKNICEIGEERIRRAGDKIVKDLKEMRISNGMLEDDSVDPDNLDIGFKVFSLDSSNFTPFEGTKEGIQVSLDFETKNNERTAQDILYEIMLKYGVFDRSIIEIKIDDKTIFSIGSGYLLVCLEKEITDKTISEISKLKPRTVIFDEVCFKNDNEKDNAIYILQKAGVEEIKSI